MVFTLISKIYDLDQNHFVVKGVKQKEKFGKTTGHLGAPLLLPID